MNMKKSVRWICDACGYSTNIESAALEHKCHVTCSHKKTVLSKDDLEEEYFEQYCTECCMTTSQLSLRDILSNPDLLAEAKQLVKEMEDEQW